MLAGLRIAVRNTDPGYFALVMATCIVSRALQLDGADRLSGILLGTGIVARPAGGAAEGDRRPGQLAR